jgi:hypothetical protein
MRAPTYTEQHVQSQHRHVGATQPLLRASNGRDLRTAVSLLSFMFTMQAHAPSGYTPGCCIDPDRQDQAGMSHSTVRNAGSFAGPSHAVNHPRAGASGGYVAGCCPH